MALLLYCRRKWIFEKLKLMLEYIIAFSWKYLMPSFRYFGIEKKMELIFYALSSLFLEELSDE